MPRDIPLGNGTLLFLYDRKGAVRDLYYPNVGMENHAQGHQFRLGVSVNNDFLWVDDPSWHRILDYEDDTLVANVTLRNELFGVEIRTRDAVDFHENIFIRDVSVTNLLEKSVRVQLFFHHDFYIYGTEIGDTACFKPEEKAILHYKGRRYFLIGAATQTRQGIDQFATGIKKAKGLLGTWVDAEDTVLSGNPIAQGSVDSTCSVELQMGPMDTAKAHYWMGVDKNWKGVERLHALVQQRGVPYFIKRTSDFWKLWLEKDGEMYASLPAPVARLYKRSLLILRMHVNHNGAIIASPDSDIQHFYRDTYCYLWPRDGAIIAHALDLAGYAMPARKFFEFCGEIIGRDGYFLHKYTPEGALASSWHPWVVNGTPGLPIQEDETGLVVWALWKHFSRYRDAEFIKPLYRKLIKSAGDFMSAFTNPETGLPLPSYDLWEEQHAIHAYTVFTVIEGLLAAARFAESFGEIDISSKYRSVAERMKRGFLTEFYDAGMGRYVSRVFPREDGSLQKDPSIDASLFALSIFESAEDTDGKIRATLNTVREKLWCKSHIGGIARYENDPYQAVMRPSGDIPGNPWIITTLWYAQHLLREARNENEMEGVMNLLSWVSDRAFPSGVLPEQLNPFTGDPISVSPLAWSHAEYVITVQRYLEKLRTLAT